MFRLLGWPSVLFMQSAKDWFEGKLILFFKMTKLGSNIGEQAKE